MTDINTLIAAAKPHIPFQSTSAATVFLSNYSTDDGAALISALYIGRSHLGQTVINSQHLQSQIPFNRYFSTGGSNGQWDIAPSEFARILYEKNTNLTNYYDTFLVCCAGSGINLAHF